MDKMNTCKCVPAVTVRLALLVLALLAAICLSMNPISPSRLMPEGYFGDYIFSEVSILSPFSSSTRDDMNERKRGTTYTINAQIFEIREADQILSVALPVYLPCALPDEDELLSQGLNRSWKEKYQIDAAHKVMTRDGQAVRRKIYLSSSHPDLVWIADYADNTANGVEIIVQSVDQVLRMPAYDLETLDYLSGYLYVIDYMASEQNLRGKNLKYLAIDTSTLTGLKSGDRARLLSELDAYNLVVLDKTMADLKAEGYIKHSDTVFENGALITFDNIRIKGSVMTMDAFIYYAGTSGWGLMDFDITWDGSRWNITRTEITVQA